ncbi:hypothetical protein M378DRAFT_168448 [Amanita muscaria Koide BX008]|uniref:Uncharacterized protein n=1 Tax=Amanita muscaria (strain Koide BX008) TaxID=946122 RepID=A0A0C2WFG9_AMAMK|nr:hypothetical protein M378DRAFT_168448 [Amanita muscaria Koide BX008]
MSMGPFAFITVALMIPRRTTTIVLVTSVIIDVASVILFFFMATMRFRFFIVGIASTIVRPSTGSGWLTVVVAFL